MAIFEYSFEIKASLEDVLAFHHDARALKKLNPPPVIVELHEVEPLGEGSVAEFTLWFGPFPIRWKAVHSDVGRHGFTDTLVKGPAQSWIHSHRFTKVNENLTRIDEHIEYEHKPGLSGLVTRLLFSRFNLTVMFTYRQWVTRRELEKASFPNPSRRPDIKTPDG